MWASHEGCHYTTLSQNLKINSTYYWIEGLFFLLISWLAVSQPKRFTTFNTLCIFYRAMRIHSANMLSQDVRPTPVLCRNDLNVSSNFVHHLVDPPFWFFSVPNLMAKVTQTPPNGRVKRRWGVKNRNFRPISPFI